MQIQDSSDDSVSNYMKNMRGVPQIETVHKVANVVAKLSFPLFFMIIINLMSSYLRW